MIPFTVEQCMADAAEARAKGYPELAETFEQLADKIAAHNERHAVTVQEARERMGEDEFRRLFHASLERGSAKIEPIE